MKQGNRLFFHLKHAFQKACNYYPLHKAAKDTDHRKLLHALNKATLRDLYVQDRQGKTPWDRARESGNNKNVTSIFAAMANHPVPTGKEKIREPIERSHPHIGFSKPDKKHRIKW